MTWAWKWSTYAHLFLYTCQLHHSNWHLDSHKWAGQCWQPGTCGKFPQWFCPHINVVEFFRGASLNLIVNLEVEYSSWVRPVWGKQMWNSAAQEKATQLLCRDKPLKPYPVSQPREHNYDVWASYCLATACLFTEPLPSNGRLLLLNYSVMQQYFSVLRFNIHIILKDCAT
jgi:hypothetical protein